MLKKVIDKVQGFRTQDGAVVSLVRVLGNGTVKKYDPFLMMDAFDSTDPKDHINGFPMHPHRGIETVTFLSRGIMVHEDHLGTKATIHDGEAQWLTAGSGAFHSEMPQPSDRMLGIQLWLNLPAKDKLKVAPFYHGILNEEIKEFPLEQGKLRLITGQYNGETGMQGKYLPLDFYDIHLAPGETVTLDVPEGKSSMVFTLLGDAIVSDSHILEKTAARLGEGDRVTITACQVPVEILFISSDQLEEPVAWAGPIVMNSQQQLMEAFSELEHGEFVKQEAGYENQ